ncbi:MAG: AIR synthase family protein [Candidatus Marinimicrobia bacterium]|nr:AIR synthase family protein [Candidatus Neomarinimicrobiota bacterium]MCF7828888.1 AIR synthase family protein [Candidatus Neomarinimicrobiota bacterium]MCF7879848.1 AIR synthase family protein [Candidatus Neomarinimicrobiota bacterium]
MASDLPEVGKVSSEVFDEIILPRLGKKRDDVLVGPQHGVDIGVIDLGNGQVQAMSTDPVFIVPPYGWERSAWFAVHILASDTATSGLAPSHMTIDLNMPLGLERDQLESMWSVIHEECEKLGIAIVSGHTGRYEGCNYPMVGGATVFAIGSKDKYVTPAMAEPGDRVIVTKGPAIEASALFAVTFPGKVEEAYGKETANEAEDIFWQMSVVEEALTAAEVGVRENGVTGMHDATECGIWGGLAEIATASDVGLNIEKDEIILQDAVEKVCRLWDIDPYISISEGTLIITSKAHKADEIIRRLEGKDIPASIVGEVTPGSEGTRYFEDGKEHELVHPKTDPFWAAYGKAAEGE